ncbi:SCO6880 family protein [Dactylosporangium sp. NPDC051541]|uniref:SCO6880 family protein n=1 Tax=Dactylosporangium sp. NPDC051541 TaxID=3363977 RepID=UPI0037BBCBD6
MHTEPDTTPAARIPADVDTPDKIVYGLTARQLAVLAVAAVTDVLLYHALARHLPAPLLIAVLIPATGAGVAVAFGARDGLPLERWLGAALRWWQQPRRLVPRLSAALPPWAPRPATPAPAVAALRLPATAITAAGVIEAGEHTVALVAATTVNIGLRTGDEQEALLAGFGRWLNGLTGPVQLVVAAQRVDLDSHAQRVAAAVDVLPHPALAAAAADYAAFLGRLAAERDLLARRVTVAVTGPAGPGREREVLRRAEHTATALAALGAETAVLDGPRALALLATATDPYTPADTTWPRSRPDLPVTATGTTATGPADAETLATTVGPAAVHDLPGQLQLGDGYAATLVVTGYPAQVGAAWLDPLLAWPGRLDVVLYVEPLTAQQATTRLRRQRARLESNRRTDAGQGRLVDPATDAAADDAAELADRVARGESRLFRVGLYLCVHAATRDELADAVAQIRTTAASLLLDTQPATWRQLTGWLSTLPLGFDGLRMRRVMDTDAVAAAFPLAGPDLPVPLPGTATSAGGVLYGLNRDSAGVLWWDVWAQHNANSVILARSGAGKSYFVKLGLLRALADGVHCAVIDPDNEYLRLAEATGGATVTLGAAGVRVNPLDIPAGDRRPQARTDRALFLHTLIAVLLGEALPPAERAALDRAILDAYDTAGITADPHTWDRPAPLLRDVATALDRQRHSAGTSLAARLVPWTSGSFRALFDGPTTTAPTGHLVVFSTRLLAEELRPAGMLLALDAIWRCVDGAGRSAVASGPGGPPRRQVIVDEAWTLLQDAAGARFLARLAKSARKRRAGLTVVTQDVGDLLGSALGQVVVANAATQILLRQAPQAIDAVAEAFGLTGGEARLLLTARRGEGLLLCGAQRAGFTAVASPAEHRLCIGDLDPAEQA